MMGEPAMVAYVAPCALALQAHRRTIGKRMRTSALQIPCSKPYGASRRATQSTRWVCSSQRDTSNQKSPGDPESPNAVSGMADPEAGAASVTGFASNADYRGTRKVLTGLASVGVLETLFLFGTKLFSSPAAICSTSGCIDVLSGPYSTIAGIPLSALGVVAYGIFAYLAAWPLTARAEEVVISDDGDTEMRSAEEMYKARDAATRPLLLAMASALFVFSSYFMFLLLFVIRDMCPYCVLSICLSTALFVITAFLSRAVQNALAAARISGASIATSTATAAAVFILTSPGGLLAQMPTEPQMPPEITTRSDSRSLDIARKLQRRGAKMYGAYWCTHCYDQKQRLGKKAFNRIGYIECDKGGFNSQYKLCREMRIPGYPTWEIDGELYPGELPLDDLEKLANGEGLGY